MPEKPLRVYIENGEPRFTQNKSPVVTLSEASASANSATPAYY